MLPQMLSRQDSLGYIYPIDFFFHSFYIYLYYISPFLSIVLI